MVIFTAMPRWNHFRAHERFPVQMGATVQIPLRNAEAQGRVDNVGLGGLALTLPQAVRLGERLSLKLWGPRAIELEGEVAWVAWAAGGGVRAGVRFRFESGARIEDLLTLLASGLPQGPAGRAPLPSTS